MNHDLLLQTLQSDLLANILEYAADIKQCSKNITIQVREMIGARVVALLATNPGGECHLLAACPERREIIFNDKDIRRLVTHAESFKKATLIEPGQGESGRILAESGMKESFVVPLRVGEESFGMLVLLDLMDTNGIHEIFEALRGISGLLSMVFKQSFLYHNMESLVAERTEALWESELRSLDILQTAMDGFLCIDVVGGIVDVNDSYCRMSGYSRHELLKMTVSQLAVKLSQEEIAESIETILSGRSVRFETTHQRKDGSLMNLEISSQLRSGSNGKEIVSFLRDTTERKKAEALLRKSEEKFQTIANHIQNWEYWIAGDGSLVFIAPSCERITGYTAEEFCQDPGLLTKIIHQDSRENFLHHIDELTEGVSKEDCQTMDFRILTRNGEERWISHVCRNVFDQKGKSIGHRVSNVDISERKQAEAELIEYSQRLQLATSSGRLAVWDWNVKDNIMFWDDRMFELYGTSRDAFPNTIDTWINGLHPDDKQRAIEESNAACLGEKEFNTTFRVLHPDGTIKHLKANAIVIRDQNGKVIRMIGINSDITEQIQAEEEKRILEAHLLQAQKMEAIGTLAGGIAHDFNNILGAIIGYAEMAEDDSPAGSTVRNDIEQVVKASYRAKDLVKQILAFSHHGDTELIPIKPSVIIKEAIKMLRSSIPTTIAIQQNIDSESGLILADPTQIHQIMMNLCTNAFHAMEETGGILTITLKKKTLCKADLPSTEPHIQPGDFLQMSIEDTGAGIAPHIMNKIFEPYFTTKGVGKGTGMGLAIIHGIVKTYGGFLTCHSTLGKGTIFNAYLPVMQDTTLSQTEPLDIFQFGNERILYIDDEEILAEMGRTMMERLGYKVTCRTNSIEALMSFQNQPEDFDLVITDQTMPGMTGVDLARRMMQIRPDLPIILCTGYSSQVSEEKAKSYGIKGFAMKPLAKKDLASLIRKVLDE